MFTLNYYSGGWYTSAVKAIGSIAPITRAAFAKHKQCVLCKAAKPSRLYLIFEPDHEAKTLIFKKAQVVCEECSYYLNSLQSYEDVLAHLSKFVNTDIAEAMIDEAILLFRKTKTYQFDWGTLIFQRKIKERF